MTHALCLEEITVWGLAPPDFAKLGCAAVSLWVQWPTPQTIAPPLARAGRHLMESLRDYIKCLNPPLTYS